MVFQIPSSIQRQTSKPVLSAGGMTWNLSNLCSTQNESYSWPPNRPLERTHHRQTRREQSIYPSKEDLGRYLPSDIDTSDIFDRSRSPRPRSRGVVHRRQILPSGANNEFDQLKVPFIYTRQCDPTACDADEFSDRYYQPQERDYSSWQYRCSQSEVPHDLPASISEIPSVVTTQSSSHSVESSERKPVQVEVYPGEFLQLRGAKETVAAVEGGHSKYVVCYACGLGLRCVADCDLVICPGCRIMAPAVPRRPPSLFEDTESEDEDTSCMYRKSLPQRSTSLWTDDARSFHSSKQNSDMRSRNGSRVESTGGVGLGLRIENY